MARLIEGDSRAIGLSGGRAMRGMEYLWPRSCDADPEPIIRINRRFKPTRRTRHSDLPLPKWKREEVTV